jgi:hypothetical protein
LPTEQLIEVSQISPDLVLGMLAARGIEWSESDLDERRQAYLKAFAEWEAGAEGKSYDALEI